MQNFQFVNDPNGREPNLIRRWNLTNSKYVRSITMVQRILYSLTMQKYVDITTARTNGVPDRVHLPSICEGGTVIPDFPFASTRRDRNKRDAHFLPLLHREPTTRSGFHNLSTFPNEAKSQYQGYTYELTNLIKNRKFRKRRIEFYDNFVKSLICKYM